MLIKTFSYSGTILDKKNPFITRRPRFNGGTVFFGPLNYAKLQMYALVTQYKVALKQKKLFPVCWHFVISGFHCTCTMFSVLLLLCVGSYSFFNLSLFVCLFALFHFVLFCLYVSQSFVYLMKPKGAL